MRRQRFDHERQRSDSGWRHLRHAVAVAAAIVSVPAFFGSAGFASLTLDRKADIAPVFSALVGCVLLLVGTALLAFPARALRRGPLQPGSHPLPLGALSVSGLLISTVSVIESAQWSASAVVGIVATLALTAGIGGLLVLEPLYGGAAAVLLSVGLLAVGAALT